MTGGTEGRLLSDLLGWLADKIAETEKNIAARADSEASLRSGNEADWRMAAARTGTPPMSRMQRLEAADRDARIVVRYRIDLSMLQTAVSLLKPNA